LITRADRTLVSRQVEAEVRAYFGPLVYDRAVPSSVKFREAYARGIPLIHYDRFSPGASAYRAAAESFLRGARPELRHERGAGARGPDLASAARVSLAADKVG
jgi:cellulose biosynthesis protein BcsQ